MNIKNKDVHITVIWQLLPYGKCCLCGAKTFLYRVPNPCWGLSGLNGIVCRDCLIAALPGYGFRLRAFISQVALYDVVKYAKGSKKVVKRWTFSRSSWDENVKDIYAKERKPFIKRKPDPKNHI